ncbi:MAG TPA: cupin domain-containing protein, partial [Acidimicrobiales bacterium]|nr:cupin domain-containing protein [Acidimicrobiales bacterium]
MVTGHDGAGRPVVRADGRPPLSVEAPTGVAVAELLWLDAAPVGVDDGRDRTEGGFPLEPPPGGLSVRVIRLPPPSPGTAPGDAWLRVPGDDPAEPGMHATDTLDVVAVLDGEIVLGLDDGDRSLAAGDVVVQRGTRHRWRVTGDSPCTYAVFMVRPDPDAAGDVVGLTPGGPGTLGPRRVVATARSDGSSYASSDGAAPCGFAPPGGAGVTVVDLWQTGGPLARPSQGGDSSGEWALDPAGGGVAFRYVEMAPGHDPGDAGWHATPTIDVDLVVSGQLELSLPDVGPVVVGPGGAVVQR